MPTPVGAGAVFGQLAAGDAHTCGVGPDLEMRCWGDNSASQLGFGTVGGTGLPTTVISAFDFVSVTAGGSHTCALTSTGTAACWGRNGSGELGLGDTTRRATPTTAADARILTQIVAGARHTCSPRGRSGVALCWGSNDLGQLGDSGTTQESVPDSVRAAGFDFLATGGDHTCGASSGVAYCWGSNLRGESGTSSADTALLTPHAGGRRHPLHGPHGGE